MNKRTTEKEATPTRKSARLAIEYMTLDERLESRKLKPSVVKDYLAVLRRGGVLPPVMVVRDGRDKYYLVDGYHRVAATQQLNGVDEIAVEIIDGTFTDALWLSWGSNRDHGLRRTQKEKRRAILAVLGHPQWKQKGDRAIGRHIGCDHKTVAVMRRNLAAGELPTEPAASGTDSGPFKSAILRACRLLAVVQPEGNCQFDEAELALMTAGSGALHRLLFGAKPHLEARKDMGRSARGGRNAR